MKIEISNRNFTEAIGKIMTMLTSLKSEKHPVLNMPEMQNGPFTTTILIPDATVCLLNEQQIVDLNRLSTCEA